MTTMTLTSPSYSTAVNLVLLAVRVFLGLMIFAHGYNKAFRGGKFAGVAGWFDFIGMKPGKINAFMAIVTEMGVGILLVAGLLTPLAAAGLVALMVVAIVTVHRKNGFFVNNANGGGIEYNLALIFFSLVPGTLGAGKYSLDHVWHPTHWSDKTGLLITLIVGIGGGVLQLLAVYRPPKNQG